MSDRAKGFRNWNKNLIPNNFQHYNIDCVYQYEKRGGGKWYKILTIVNIPKEDVHIQNEEEIKIKQDREKQIKV